MPTLRAKAVLKDILESTGKSVSKSMLDNGYPPATAKNPQQLTRSKGWQELLKQYLPDDKLLEKHQQALDALKTNEFTGERLPDHGIRLKAVELGYKIKGKLIETSGNIIGDKQVIILNYSNKTKAPVVPVAPIS